jgi:NADH-quinone oxidoreductase subunit N
MNALVIAQKVQGPEIDWAGLSPLVALLAGAMFVLLAGLLRSRFIRESFVPFATIATLGAFIGLSIWQWGEDKDLISAAMRLDELSLFLNLLFGVAGIAAVLLSWRSMAPRESAHGEYYSMLLASIAGMAVLVAAQNTVTLFLGFELLSIPLYVLCATEMRRERSLESGLKYLVLGSVGSATLVYGLAFLYGATGSTDFSGMAAAIEQGSLQTDSLLLGGLGLVIVGLAFKASVAPFHQWTPDVYEGAPTPITAFMAVATKAAAFGVLLRLLDVALIDVHDVWGPALACLATITIIVGNVAAIGQTSLKRLLAWSSVAQAGYLLAGVIVGTQLGVRATCFYLAVYLAMNLAAFSVIVARERETGLGDHIDSVAGTGVSKPVLGVPLTIAMLGLAGIPATGGFIGKFFLIQAAVDNGYTWLGVVIVLGSAISLAYYLRVVAAVWMRPAAAPARTAPGTLAPRPLLAGGSPEVDGTGDAPTTVDRGPRTHPEVAFVAVVAAAATIVAGVAPGPLFDLVRETGSALGNLL